MADIEQIKSKLHINKILIDEFQKLVNEIDPYSERLSEVLKRAHVIRLKMQMMYVKADKPPELLEQIKQIEKIIKKVEQLHNKYVTGL